MDQRAVDQVQRQADDVRKDRTPRRTGGVQCLQQPHRQDSQQVRCALTPARADVGEFQQHEVVGQKADGDTAAVRRQRDRHHRSRATTTDAAVAAPHSPAHPARERLPARRGTRTRKGTTPSRRGEVSTPRSQRVHRQGERVRRDEPEGRVSSGGQEAAHQRGRALRDSSPCGTRDE